MARSEPGLTTARVRLERSKAPTFPWAGWGRWATRSWVSLAGAGKSTSVLHTPFSLFSTLI